MRTASDVTQLIGNTPLLHLKQVSEKTGCTILGKAEFLNPGGSVKDRTALGILQAAQESGDLKPGGRIVEGTAGNTGIGLTLLANAMGYQSTVVMPVTQSKEKIDTLELAEKFNKSEENGAVWARQFDNLANMEIHQRTTGEEIWEQTDGSVDGFVCAAGTGGTIAGISTALKGHNADVTIGLADPSGASLYEYKPVMGDRLSRASASIT